MEKEAQGIATAGVALALVAVVWLMARQANIHAADPPTPVAAPPAAATADARLAALLAGPHDASALPRFEQALNRTNEPPDHLLAESTALASQPSAADKILAGDFLKSAVARIRANLTRADLARPRSDTAPDLSLLWTCLASPAAENQWALQSEIYTTLAEWEPDKTTQRYRARLKLADAQLYDGRPDRGLNTMDSLMADIAKGDYPAANPHDIVPLYWTLCHNADRIDQGLAYLRAVVQDDQGRVDERRMTAILIAALADTGRSVEARDRLSRWTEKFAATAPPQSIDQLNRSVAVSIAVAEARPQ